MVQSLKKTIGVGTAWFAGGNAFAKLFGLANIALALTYLSVYEYGLVALVLSVPALMGLINLPGLENVVTADAGVEKTAGNRKKMHFIITSFFTLRCLLGLLGFLLLFSIAPYVEAYYNQGIATMVRVVSFSFLLSPFRSLYQIVFRVSFGFKYLSLFRVFEEFGKFLVLVVMLVFLQMGAVSMIVAYVSADLFGLLLLSVPFRKAYTTLFKKTVKSDGWKHPFFLLRDHGKWAVFAVYPNMLSKNVRVWIIKFFLDTQAVGLYTVAYGIYQNTATLVPLSKIINPIIPQYIERKKILYKLINSSIKYQIFAFSIFSIVLISVLPLVLDTFFPKYSGVYVLYVLLLAGLVPASFSSAFEPVFYALKAQKNLFYVGVVRLTAVIFLLPFFIFLFGMSGIAIEFFITWSMYTFERYRKLRQFLPEYSFSFKDMFRITKADKILMHQTGQVVKKFVPFLRSSNLDI